MVDYPPGPAAPGWSNEEAVRTQGGSVLTSLNPATAVLGDPAFTLQVIGSGFSPASKILWNGVPEPTTFVSDTELTTLVDMSTAQVAISIPVVAAENGAESNALTFELTSV
jgi:hypothetical protein